MHTINELYNLEEKPKINEISLEILQQYSATYLEPYEFRFILNDATSTVINLRFPQNRFPHLLGTETVAKKGRVDRINFKGQRAYDRIKSGELTFETLKNIHKPTFKSLKDKLIYFYQIPHLVMSTEVIFKFTKVSGSNIECELLIYTEMHGVIAHLGLEKENSGSFYIARTFIIERNLGTKYIDAQLEEEKKDILCIQQSSLSNGSILKTVQLINTHEDGLNALPE